MKVKMTIHELEIIKWALTRCLILDQCTDDDSENEVRTLLYDVTRMWEAENDSIMILKKKGEEIEHKANAES